MEALDAGASATMMIASLHGLGLMAGFGAIKSNLVRYPRQVFDEI